MVESAALLVDEILPKVPVRQWVLSLPIPLRLLLAHNPEAMGKVLQVVVRAISSFLIRRAGYRVGEAHTGTVTLIQCFGSALNLNLHYHILFLDGVYIQNLRSGYLKFQRIKAPSQRELTPLLQRISQRIANALVRQGLLVTDESAAFPADDDDFDEVGESTTLRQLQSHSVSCRIAVGPRAGRKALMLKTLPPMDEWDCLGQAAKVDGFSLHAGVAATEKQRDKLERLCRYVTRPPVSEKRLELTAYDQVRYRLKTPYKDGTTHIILAPLGRGKGGKRGAASQPTAHSNRPTTDWADKTPQERHQAMRWAQRLKRVFDIDVETCVRCGGQVKVIACIEDPVAIKKILAHLASFGSGVPSSANKRLPEARAPPPIQGRLFR